MRRLNLPELADRGWWPGWARDAMTGYLHAIIARTNAYAPAARCIADLLRIAGSSAIVDLCSGGGGPWPSMRQALAAEGVTPEVTCTDLAPNRGASARLQSDGVRYLDTPVSALDVPPSLRGTRTMFSALHHFSDEDVRAILADAQQSGVPFAAFEATSRSVKGVAATIVIPFAVLALMPTVRPRDWRALWLTYLPPLMPLAIWWDGLASTLRTSSVEELRRIVASLPPASYRWRVEEIGDGPLPILAVLGQPDTATPR